MNAVWFSFPCCENGTCITGSPEILLKHVGPLVPDAAVLSLQSLWTSSGVQAKDQVLYVFDCSKFNRHAALMFLKNGTSLHECCVVFFSLPVVREWHLQYRFS